MHCTSGFPTEGAGRQLVTLAVSSQRDVAVGKTDLKLLGRE